MKTLLYIDDNDDDRFLLENAARLAGVSFSVKTLDGGVDAVRFFKAMEGPDGHSSTPPPSLVFLDLKMPEMDGFQVLQWMRSNPPTSAIPVVLFSASPIHRDIERGYSEGANYFITKPSELRTLIEIMRAADRFMDSATECAALEPFSAVNPGLSTREARIPRI